MITDILDRLEKVLPIIRDNAQATDDNAKFPTESISALADSGLMGVNIPVTNGGLGYGPVEFAHVVREIAQACGSTSMIYLMHMCSVSVIAAAPPSNGGDQLVKDLASGKKLATLAFSEKGSRSHFWAPVSQAKSTDEDKVSIVAEKSWVTSASEADVYVITSQAPEGESPVESNLYVVDRTALGVKVSGQFTGLGLRGNDSAPVSLDIELSNSTARLGEEKTGFGQLMSVVLPWFCLGNSAVSVGLARAALTGAIDHASASRFEYSDSTLADLPTIRAYIAKAWVQLASIDALLEKTAEKIASPDDSTILFVLGSKAGCNEGALNVTDLSMRIAGGAGFSKQLGIDRPARDARAGFVMAPTSDALFDVLGKGLCGMDLF